MAPADVTDKQSFFGRIATWLSPLRQTPRVLALVWKAYPVSAVVVPLLALVSAPVPALTLFSLKKVIDGVTLWLQGDPAGGRETILIFFGLVAALRLLQSGLESLRQFMERLLERRLAHYIQGRILERAVNLDISFFETPSFYDKLARAQGGIGYRPFAIMSSLMRGIHDIGVLAGYAVLLATLAWWVVPCLVTLALPAFILQARYGQMGWFIAANRTPEKRRMDYYSGLLTSDAAAKEIRLFRLGDYFISQWKDLFRRFYQQDRRFHARSHLGQLVGLAIQTAGAVALYGFAIYRTIARSGVTIGSLFMYMQAIDQALDSISRIFLSLGGLYENNLYMRGLFEYLAQEPQMKTPSPARAVPEPIRDGLRLEGVRFRYPEGTRDVLEDLSLEIRPGEKVALVGENGAGKTTLVKLLARLYDPGSGRITVDGIDLRELDAASWQQQIGIIFQDFAHYAVAAKENIALGDIDRLHDMEAIRAAARKSGADKCVERLDHQWDTILGKVFDEGQELSVGEWQRIALARAFFREAQILILDEPTASLDAKQEYEIFKQFNELTRGKTTILVSHRFSSVRMADRIFVMEKGRVVESGTHEELTTLRGRYCELYSRQAEAYR